MLSASVLATAHARVVNILSPAKNPCRVRIPSTPTSNNSWYRYDPYVSKVVPSPLKTAMSPSFAAAQSVAAPPEAVKNSLFAAPLRNTTPAAERTVLPPVKNVQPAVSSSNVANTKAPSSESGKTHYAVITFKHDSATFIAPFRVAVGDQVIVEGDRGEDLGTIQEITTETPSYPVPLKIVRRASNRDKQVFVEKQERETETVSEVQRLADSLSLPLEIVDTEFQFDNNKLTVYFNAPAGHTDFRKLQRSLFREHRCRIWLSNMAEVEYNAKLQQQRRTR